MGYSQLGGSFNDVFTFFHILSPPFFWSIFFMEVIVTIVIVSWVISPIYGTYIQPTENRGEIIH